MARPKGHGMTGHPVYLRWAWMKSRCLNPNDSSYVDYGGRGITVCERWMTFETFRDDMLPTYQEGLQLDRIDNDGNYEPSNCKWSTRSENTKNTRRKALLQSKVNGVSWNNSAKVWIVRFPFKTQEEAERFKEKVNGLGKA